MKPVAMFDKLKQLFNTKPKAIMQIYKKHDTIQLTKNFSLKEFQCQCKNADCVDIPVDTDFINKIQMIREKYGKPMSISSGYRCQKHNAKIGGAKASMHMSGKSIDIADFRQELQKWVLANTDFIKSLGLQCEDFKFTKTWCHFDNKQRDLGDTIFFKP
jgi:uncharacterized protein YcbK (DUF882 family)